MAREHSKRRHKLPFLSAFSRRVQILKNISAFSYKELEIATNGFCISNKIGEGGFGSVYKGRLQDGTLVAVKVLSMESKQGEKEFLSEVASRANVCHENLVKLHGGCIDGPSRILVYDYMQKNSLSQTFLAKFSWTARREIALGVARGLAYIHEGIKPHIVHRDIKPSNILLDKNLNAKISDFDLSKLFHENATHVSTQVAGTLGYLAPDYAASGHLNPKSDVYSFGVLLLQIVTGERAVQFHPELGEYYLVEKAWGMYKSKELLHLVDPLLSGRFNKNEAIRLLKVGLLCVQEKSNLRPLMSTVTKIMNDEIDIHEVEISQPGLLTNIMDVKVGQQRSSQSNSRIRKWSSQQLYTL
ncbi:Cold-responsive protein kinase 1 [Citrus sinensis]|uniref:Cold-responsive protein kinase 1 n=1 Tax=Citrus sinensis TaxID=2711 RepID=A0ACB8L4G6_CITSI|nr:Cold-responsive protein kinase 1 [Citrus sinensis]